jgi:hypothetical protein
VGFLITENRGDIEEYHAYYKDDREDAPDEFDALLVLFSEHSGLMITLVLNLCENSEKSSK